MGQLPKITVFRGIAGSGKTDALLETYRDALRQAQTRQQPGTTLWLTPTVRTQAEIRNRLLTHLSGLMLRPNVFTFDQFAEEVLKFAPEPVAPCTQAMQRILLRRVIGELTADKKIHHFRKIGETAGFLDLVLSLIAELKRSEKWPEDFTAACAKRGNFSADRELSLIYERYQTALHAANVYDGEGRFWSARSALAAGHWGRFSQLTFAAVDGFTDFTSAQYKILELLAQRAETMCLTLLGEKLEHRRDLFAKPNGVLQSLKHLGSVELREFSESLPNQKSAGGKPPRDFGEQTNSVGGTIGQVATHLFVDPREVPRRSDATGLDVIAVAGRINEVRLLAARVKQLLIDGVSPEEVVVAVRDLDEYGELFDEIFTAAGLPIACEMGRVVSRTAPMKGLVNLLTLEVEDWPFARLMALLDSGYFQPDWNEFDERRAVRDVARELRRLQISDGREWMLETLKRYAEALPTSPQDDSPATARRAGDLLKRLSAALDGLRRSHDLEGWSGVLAALCRETGFDRAPLEEMNGESDGRTLGEFTASLLYDAARGERRPTSERTRMSLAEFLAEFVDLIEHQRLPPRHSDAGRVRIVSAEQVRNLEVPHLFLAGLTETSFPRSRSDDCIYSERDRRELNAHDLALGDRSSRAQEELLMFYGIVTRARERLVLTYPNSTEEGQPLSPTPYLKSLCDLFDSSALSLKKEEVLDPVPAADRVLSAADGRVRGMAEALAGSPELYRGVCESQLAARHALHAVDLNVLRFHTRGMTHCEGVLENSRNIDWIRNRFSENHEFSATQLELYAACPFRFLMEHVLQLSPPIDPGIETDYARRGSLVHDLLAELHGASPSEAAGEIPSGSALAAAFIALLDKRMKLRSGSGAVHRALERIERRLLAEWGEAYGGQWEDYLAKLPENAARPFLPAKTETAFGAVRPRSGPGVETAAAAPALPPLVFGADRDAVQVGGRIDRIDVGELEGKTVFTVIDYKTGGRKAEKLDKSIETGRRLQLALYALAVQRLEIVGIKAEPWQIGYWMLSDTGFNSAVENKKRGGGALSGMSAEDWQTHVGNLEIQVQRFADGIRRGAFPVYSDDKQCTASCPYNTVCRVAQIRPLEKSLEKHPVGSGGAE